MGSGDSDTTMMQRVNSSSATSSSSIPKQLSPNQHLNPALICSQQQQFRQSFTGNRAGAPPPIPPVSPYSQIPATLQPRHSRSLSQPSSFFSADSLPPLNLPPRPNSVSVEEKIGAGFSPSPFTMCPSSSPRNAGDIL